MGDDGRVFVIVGASLAGAKAAEQLRQDGFTGQVVLIGAESELPYERPPLSKGYLLGTQPREKAYVHDLPWYAEQNVALRLGVRVTALDAAAHTVTIDGAETLRYDKLLLTTGSRVRELPIPGTDLAGVHYLRSMRESDVLRERLVPGARVVIIGAGWIGLETAAAARERGASATVIERDTLPLRRVLGDEVAAIFRDVHVAHGVDFRFDSGVQSLEGESGSVTHVVLTDGSRLPADAVLIGVGIQPNVELAAAAGLEIDNGVVTDENLRTSDPDIYAAGDVASFYAPLIGERIRIEHWANALNGGKAAGSSMAGNGKPYDRVPYFYTDQYTTAPSIGMEYAGHVTPGGYDRVVFRGSPSFSADSSPEFLVFWTQQGRVLGGMNVNVWDVQDQLQALVRAGYAGTPVDLDRLADPSVPLADLVGG
jgi:3-phenylpropionate/trans-cinnamate dioxygenase ferredoxin reductase subunit